MTRNKEAIANILITNELAKSDQELADALEHARRARVQIFVRGTDKNPVVELKDKLTRAIVGGSELKRRLKDAR